MRGVSAGSLSLDITVPALNHELIEMCGFSPVNTFREAHGKGMGVVDVV